MCELAIVDVAVVVDACGERGGALDVDGEVGAPTDSRWLTSAAEYPDTTLDEDDGC